MGQKERLDLDQMIYAAWMNFESNLNALWSFADNISHHADDIDHQRVKKTAAELAELFGDEPGQIETELQQFTPSLKDMDLYPDFRENSDVRETMLAFQDCGFRRRIMEWAQENPKKSHRFAEIFFTYLAHPPVDGILLRRSVLVSLASTLEILMTSLISAFYFCDKSFEPETSDKEARLVKAQKKSDIRGFENRLAAFSDIGIPNDFERADVSIPKLKELFERRNRIVHADGRIDDKYMRNAPLEYQPPGSDKGRILLVPDRYLQDELNEVLLFGFLLTQLCWRIWYISNFHKRADGAMKLSIGWHVYKKHYEIALRLIKATALWDLADPTQQLFRLEQAAILRDTGEEAEARRILATFPYSISEKNKLHWKVRLGMEALRGKTRTTQILLFRASRSNHLTEISPDWIVLQSIKKELWFEKLFESRNRGSLPAKTKARRPN